MRNLFDPVADSDILPMCYYGHPTLRSRCTEIEAITDEIRVLAGKMVKTMQAHDGIGLAAPQVGIAINLMTLQIPIPEPPPNVPTFTSPGEASLLPHMPIALVNVRLSDFSEQQSFYNEGCLSIPNVHGEVSRPDQVQLHAQLLDGREISYCCGGLLARCLQHEFDHLNGILFLDHLSTDQLKPLESQLRKLEKKTEKTLRKEQAKKNRNGKAG